MLLLLLLFQTMYSMYKVT